MTGAYSFICKERSTHALCVRLNALGGWKWWMGDSHWYGDHIACTPFDGARIRIVDFPVPVDSGWRYEADVRQAEDCATPISVIDQAFRNALAQIGAHTVTEIEWFD